MPLPEDIIVHNRYRIDGVLAQGGMGVIYRAFDTNLNTPIAIKENFLQTPQAINQFKREAFILARLRHPGLPRVIDHFSFEERQYLVMDFIEGEDLWSIVKAQGKPLDELQALKYIIQVCGAVMYLHQQNPPIIHRDIKPQNIKITPSDQAVLVDFGIAKQGAIESRTQSGAKGITPGFSPPEQYSGGTTAASDIFSLGAALYALLTGQKPPNSISLLAGSSKFQPPDKINVQLTHRTSEAILHAMQVKPENRPESVFAWQKELKECLEGAEETVAAMPEPSDNEETFVADAVLASLPSAAVVSDAPPVIPPPRVVPPPTPPPSAPPPAQRKRSFLPFVFLTVAIILLGALAVSTYLLYSAGLFSRLLPSSSSVAQDNTPTLTVETPTVVDAVQAEQMTAQAQTTLAAQTEQTAQAESAAEQTRQASETATPTREVILEIPTPKDTATSTPMPTSKSKSGDTLKPTGTAASVTPTKSATLSRVSSGPTLVPLKSSDTVPILGALAVIDVDMNIKNPREVYALVKGDGIYKSTSSGDGPWTKLNIDAASVTAFVIDPHNPSHFYAPTWNAVLKSTDGGNSWKAFGNGLSTANRVVDLVVVDPVDPDLLYGAIGTTLIVSTDGGQNWTSEGYSNGLGGGRITSIVIDRSNTDIVYVAGLFGSIYKSTDSARNFVSLPYGVGEGVFSMVGHPSQKDVYLAGINAYHAAIIKTENGADFVDTSSGLVYGGADSAYCALAYAPSNANIVYAGSGYEENRFAKGIFKSTDGGKNWNRISNGLSLSTDTGQPYYVKSLIVHPTNPNIALAATGGGLFKTVDGGQSWVLK